MKPTAGVGFALLAMCAFCTQPSESLLILDILKVAQMSFNSFYHTWDLFEAKLQPGPDSPYYQEKIYPEEFVMKDHPSFFVKKDEMSLIAKINEINRKIANIEDKMRAHEESMMRQLELIPHVIMTEMKVNQVLGVVQDVESLHERFTRYMKTGVTEIKKEGKPGLDRATLINFANFVTSHQPTTPLSFLDKLHAIIVPHLDSDRLLGTKSFFYTFKDYMTDICGVICGQLLIDFFVRLLKQTIDKKPHISVSRVNYCHKESCVAPNLGSFIMWPGVWCMILLSAAASVISDNREITEIDEVRNNVMKRIDELWSETSTWQVLAKKKPGFDGDLVTEFRKICELIDAVHTPDLPLLVLDHIWTYALIMAEENNILGTYSTFRKLQVRPDPVIFAGLWKQLATTVLNDGLNKRSLSKSLGVLQEMIDDGIEGHENIFQATLKNAEEFACDVNQSPQQLLFNMYTTFQLTQLKAYTMVHFSWMLLRLYDQGNFTLESEMLKNSYLQRMSQQALAIKAVMKDCRSDMWACDPKEHIEGSTYERVTKFLQGYIVNEVDLNTDNTCRENCASYNYGKQYGCFKDQFCAHQQPCRGNIVGCKFVDSDMWICQSNHFSDRRYDWIEYENGRTLGQRQKCNRAVRKVDSWWRYLFWHCSYCFCYCDDPQDPQSDRYFSLRPVTVDTANNKVMTGLRFIKVNRIFHLQAQQGEMLPHGEINETSVEWVPINAFSIKDEGVEVGKDYHMLTWQARALDLDDIKLPAGHVLTGIKLRRIGGHLNLEIMGTAFNYTTGKLTNNGSRNLWVGNDNTDGAFHQPRTPHVLKNPDAPSKSNGLNKVDSRPDTFVEFTSSDADLDIGQTPVPYVDTQAVTPKPPVALVGAGIFHKGRSYSGGYVAPKVFTYNPSDNIQDVFPDINEADF